jgi:creatinine amidohydrolase/Fe(II)-dependent formamide hydrolase-like protein
MPLALERISAARLQALPKDQTVFFFPLAPLEDFGPHLPMGLHLARASRAAWLAAERLEAEKPGWTGVILPQAPLGIDAVTSACAVTVRGHVLRDWVVDAAESLARLGFRHFVCFSGQPGPRSLTAIEEAARMLRRRVGRGVLGWIFHRGRLPVLVSAESGLTTIASVRESPLWPDPAEHGGALDTSLALWLAPDLVDPSYQALPAREREPGYWERARRRWKRTLAGYWGKPAAADAALGEQKLREHVADVFPKLRAVWEGANAEGLFRSWYSVIPPNRSFFKAWLMVTALGLLMAWWAYLSFQTLISPG